MHDYKSRINRKAKAGHSTDGKMKGGSCVATPLAKTMAKRNRSYKHPYYQTWINSCNIKNRKV